MALVTLIEATPLLPAGTTTATVRLGGGGTAGKPYTGYRSATDWRGGVITRPRFASAIPFSQSGFSGGAVPQTSTLGFSSTDQSLMDTLAGYFWKGAKFTMWQADDAVEPMDWVVRMDGTVADHSFQDNRLTLITSDATEDLNVPVAAETFAGTGGLEGDEEAKGRVKRRNLGRVFNVEGRILDKANQIWEFGDPERRSQSFEALKDKGLAGTMTVVAWAGSAAATLAALIASAPTEGGGCVAASIQCAKWWTTPAGPLTADLKGESTPSYVEKAADIANRLVTDATANITLTNVSAINTVRPGPAGLHFASGSETVTEALDRLLLPLSVVWVLSPDSTMTLEQYTWDDPVETIEADRIARETAFYPLRTIKIGYQANNRVHTDGEISSSIDDDLLGVMAQIEIIQSDGWLSAGEKPSLITLVGRIVEEYPYIVSTASDLSVSSSSYTTKKNALMTYLGTLSPAYTDTTTDTVIVPATFHAKFDDYEDAKAAINEAINSNIAATADSKIITSRQAGPPSGPNLGDLWIESDNNNKLWRWNGSAWGDARDGDIALAQAAANSADLAADGAQATADIKVTTFFQTSTPTAITLGDLWYSSATKLLKRWNGSTWADSGSLGADWLSTLTGIPVELTDGRIDDAIDTDGTIKGSKVSTLSVEAGALSERAGVELSGVEDGSGSTVTVMEITVNTPEDSVCICQITGAQNYYNGNVPAAGMSLTVNGSGGNFGSASGTNVYAPVCAAGGIFELTGGASYTFRARWTGDTADVKLLSAVMTVDAVMRNAP